MRELLGSWSAGLSSWDAGTSSEAKNLNSTEVVAATAESGFIPPAIMPVTALPPPT
jgi:hypothetical protein